VRRALLFALILAGAGWADEGMWLYDQFPGQEVRKKYGFEVTREFLDAMRMASMKIGGGTASFVSPHGLLFTNHHVASRCILDVSSREHNYMANGFYAPGQAGELKCPDLEASVVLGIEDITARMKKAIAAAPGSAEAGAQERAATARIEKECSARSGNRCQVVTLYSGALYQLFESKRYTDIRLVFAPEESLAAFGGDPDNFTYPRYDLDITFFRAYEDGKPAQTPHYLKFSREGARDGELVFISGSPGSTDRFITYAEFEYLRDNEYPLSVKYIESAIRALREYGAKDAENGRAARDQLLRAENSYKARFWELKGLRSPQLTAEKKAREEKLRAAVQANAKLNKETGEAWQAIGAAYKKWAPRGAEYYAIEGGPRFSDLFRIARNVLRLTEERGKPNEQRLPEYADAALPTLERRTFSPAPVTDSLEIAVLANYLTFLRDQLGAQHPVVKAALGGRTPERAAEHSVTTSKLKDVAERKRLAASAQAAAGSEDGMIRLVLALDPAARAVRKIREDQLDAVKAGYGSRIAQARFALYGAAEYPDATGTLRVSFGKVGGYRNDRGQPVRWATDFAGMYAHATGEDPFKLPPSVLAAKGALELATPFDFVTTCDSTGGNSGSPTVNTKGEIVGILFDGNLESMPNRFVYSDVDGRSVHVAGQGIIEALRKVYKANRILTELGF
jgi:hypothetical protein